MVHVVLQYPGIITQSQLLRCQRRKRQNKERMSMKNDKDMNIRQQRGSDGAPDRRVLTSVWW